MINSTQEAVNSITRIEAINRAVVGSALGPWYVEGYGDIVKVRPNIAGHPAKTISLEAVISAHAPIDVLKIDIEGGEHEIFSRRDQVAKALAHVRFLQLEIHPRDGFNSKSPEYQDQIEDLVGFLKRCGFKDKPCYRRKQHPGDFCSHNHNFDG